MPRLNIPVFHGDYNQWLPFKDLYLGVVHNNKTLTNIQRFQYLHGLLGKGPMAFIQHIPVINISYEEANGFNQRDDSGKYIKIRILLDSGSQACFLSETFAKRHSLNYDSNDRISVTGNSTTTPTTTLQTYEANRCSFGSNSDHGKFHLPHHFVLKNSTTTKFRAVFDCSCKTENSVSLNEMLAVGAKQQRDIFEMLCDFRRGNFAVTADITKLYRQKLWLIKSGWDDILPERLVTDWMEFQNNFNMIKTIQIPRCVSETKAKISLHCFCNASEQAYASLIYCKQKSADGTSVNLPVSKTKVAPIKLISILRLELLGAALLVSLLQAVLTGLDMSIQDSKINA
ncbi:uncharacterized protein CEXT_148481 [Caerostris extrusa]|uniref:Peptidase aspartic putative domain-containing protein n=1 Tax=Caerostris extrusa TaxID=172846 RepID=A0AAV4X7A0_CAEEX|nr:uncharacterized protein CEXT_148481 [Caerostris extrusa]